MSKRDQITDEEFAMVFSLTSRAPSDMVFALASSLIALAEIAQKKPGAPAMPVIMAELARMFKDALSAHSRYPATQPREKTARTFEDLRPAQALALTEGIFSKLGIKVEQ